ncbi:MAG: hypothetical protein GX804_09100 [Lentisphaerae bacterium]|nr:hypothetical protein [Lentisphaerota bacterium]
MKTETKKIIHEAFFSSKPKDKFSKLIRQLVLFLIFAPATVFITIDIASRLKRDMMHRSFINQRNVMAHAAQQIVWCHLSNKELSIQDQIHNMGQGVSARKQNWKDAWEQLMILEHSADGERLRMMSYGKDCAPGGKKLNSDWVIDFDFSGPVTVSVAEAPDNQAWHLGHKLLLELSATGLEWIETYPEGLIDQSSLVLLQLKTRPSNMEMEMMQNETL